MLTERMGISGPISTASYCKGIHYDRRRIDTKTIWIVLRGVVINLKSGFISRHLRSNIHTSKSEPVLVTICALADLQIHLLPRSIETASAIWYCMCDVVVL